MTARQIQIQTNNMALPILILDGGLGTTLESPPYNITFTSDTPLWSSHLLSSPSTLHQVHHDFLFAGADIILTATYQTSFEGFTRTDPQYTRDHAVRYMRSAIPLARGAFPSHDPRKIPRVALSLGPYGATMTPVAAEYSGEYPEEMDDENALRTWHGTRLGMFAEEEESWNGMEYVAFETVRRADEVRAIRGTVSDVLLSRKKTMKPWWICGVFPAQEVDEDDVRRWVRAAVGNDGKALPRPWGIGVNCSRIENIGPIVCIMQDEVRKLIEKDQFVDEWQTTSGRPWLVLYPDGTQGEEYDPTTKQWVKKGTASRRPWEEMYWETVSQLKPGEWEGVIMGGCCRTGPGQIAALREKVINMK